MRAKTLILDPRVITVEQIVPDDTKVVLVARTRRCTVPCPVCGQAATRVHSWYNRSLRDLTWQGLAVRMELYTRQAIGDDFTLAVDVRHHDKPVDESLHPIAVAHERSSTRHPLNKPAVIKLKNPDPKTARIFAEGDIHPVPAEIAGKRYRIERGEHDQYDHPRRMSAAKRCRAQRATAQRIPPDRPGSEAQWSSPLGRSAGGARRHVRSVARIALVHRLSRLPRVVGQGGMRALAAVDEGAHRRRGHADLPVVAAPQARRAEMLEAPGDQPEFDVLPRRWLGARTVARIARYRCISEDDERLPATSEAMIHRAGIRLLLGRRA